MEVFVTGGTGYIGQRLIVDLLKRGHAVTAVVRRGSEGKLPDGCRSIVGDALKGETFEAALQEGETFVQLVGVAHPSPFKVRQFHAVDLRSALESASVAARRRVGHFIYLSVAQPSPIMREYVEIRRLGEAAIRQSGVPATFVRPLYVLGPGHRWPYVLLPFYALFEALPVTRETARRLHPVTLTQVVSTLVSAVENRADGIRIVDADAIRAAASLDGLGGRASGVSGE